MLLINCKPRKYSKYASFSLWFFSTVLVWSNYFIRDGTMPGYSQLHKHSCYTQLAVILTIWIKCCGDEEEGKSRSPWSDPGDLSKDHDGGTGFQGVKCGGRSFQGKRTACMWGPTAGDDGSVRESSDSGQSLTSYHPTLIFNCHFISEKSHLPSFFLFSMPPMT